MKNISLWRVFPKKISIIFSVNSEAGSKGWVSSDKRILYLNIKHLYSKLPLAERKTVISTENFTISAIFLNVLNFFLWFHKFAIASNNKQWFLNCFSSYRLVLEVRKQKTLLLKKFIFSWTDSVGTEHSSELSMNLELQKRKFPFFLFSRLVSLKKFPQFLLKPIHAPVKTK